MHRPMSTENHHVKRPRGKHNRFLRFIRGYLMIVGGMTTGYVLLQLVVWLLVEAAKIL